MYTSRRDHAPHSTKRVIELNGIRRYYSAEERTVRRTAGFRETPSPEPVPVTLANHVVPFTDHRGGRSFMVFENDDASLLPPLVQFSIFFTHLDSHPDSHSSGYPEKADLTALHDQIRNAMEEFHFRLDIYFLPGAQETDCISHYQAERAVRGNSIAMLQEAKEILENDLPPPTATSPRLLGMLANCSDGGKRYGGLPCIYHEYSWREGEQRLCCVQFDPKFAGASKSDFAEWHGFPKPDPAEVDDDNIFGSSDEYLLGSWM
ncbi:hypothetical protein BDV12DRAFT_197472 [Aspergillus spectabilis]